MANLHKFGTVLKLVHCAFITRNKNNLFVNFLYYKNPKSIKKWLFLSLAGHTYPGTPEIDFGHKVWGLSWTMPDKMALISCLQMQLEKLQIWAKIDGYLLGKRPFSNISGPNGPIHLNPVPIYAQSKCLQ